jgi:4'-phosphopantetheinyl transferase
VTSSHDVSREASAVHLYYADRRTLNDERVAALVTAEDRERVTPTMAPRRRAEYLAGRALLRHALAAYTGRDAASFRVSVSPAGKPECVAGPAVSVSHSGDAIVCAVADLTVGVDVEATPPRDIDAIAQRWFTPAEAAWVAADPAARFCQLWVLKEAYLKAIGLGLSGGLDALECRIEPPRVLARIADGAGAPQLVLLRRASLCVGIAALGAPGPVRVACHDLSAGERGAAPEPLELLATT